MMDSSSRAEERLYSQPRKEKKKKKTTPVSSQVGCQDPSLEESATWEDGENSLLWGETQAGTSWGGLAGIGSTW